MPIKIVCILFCAASLICYADQEQDARDESDRIERKIQEQKLEEQRLESQRVERKIDDQRLEDKREDERRLQRKLDDERWNRAHGYR